MLEVQVWAPDGTTMLDILDGASSVAWTDLLNDVGSGSCQLSIYNSKYTPANVRKGNLIKLCLNGAPVFAFFNTSPKLTIGEAGTSIITLAGTAALSYLGRAAAFPPGGVASPTGPSWTFSNVSAGYVLDSLLRAAQDRGTIPALVWYFSAFVDSAGVAFAEDVNLTIDPKSTILDVVQKLIAQGIGVSVDPSLQMTVYGPGTQGADRSGAVVFQQGRHFIGPVDNIGSLPATVVLVEGAGGSFVEVSNPAYTSDPAFGRIETALDYSTVTSDVTQMVSAGEAQLALSETAGQAITVKLNHGTGGLYEPYRDYNLGDTVAINVPGQYANVQSQVVGLTIAQTPSNDYTVDVKLGSISLPLDLRLARMLASSTGTTSNVSGGPAGNLTLGNPAPGVPSGVSFPTNAAPGMLFFRPDLGEAYQLSAAQAQYSADPGQWLSTAEHHVNLINGSFELPFPFSPPYTPSAFGSSPGFGVIPIDPAGVVNVAAFGAFPGLAVLHDGVTLICAYLAGYDGQAPPVPTVVRFSSDWGLTWTAEQVVLANGGPGGVTVDSSGVIWIPIQQNGAGAIGYIKSTDNGATWSAYVGLTTTQTGYARTSAPIVQLANGDLILPFYGWITAGGTVDYCNACFMRSTNGGTTWTETRIASQSGSYSWTEPNIVQLANGHLVCMIREDTFVTSTYICTSSDNGATWTAPVIAFSSGGGSPRISRLFSGALICTYRGISGGLVSQRNVYRNSWDNGATWTAETAVESSGVMSNYSYPCQILNGLVALIYGRRTTTTTGDINLVYLMDGVGGETPLGTGRGGSLFGWYTAMPTQVSVVPRAGYDGLFVCAAEWHAGETEPYISNLGNVTLSPGDNLTVSLIESWPVRVNVFFYTWSGVIINPAGTVDGADRLTLDSGVYPGQATGSFVAPAGTAYARISITFYDYGTHYIDNVKVFRSDAPIAAAASLSLSYAAVYNVTTNVNNLNPGAGSIVRLHNVGAAFNITGMVAGAPGEMRVIYYDLAGGGGGDLTLKHNNSGSSVKFFVSTGADKVLHYGSSVSAIYDAINGFWLVQG